MRGRVTTMELKVRMIMTNGSYAESTSGEPSSGFTRLRDATPEEFLNIERLNGPYLKELPSRIIAALAALDVTGMGFTIGRQQHSLQSASRAHRDGCDIAYVVACLVHDIGDELAPYNHGAFAADVLAPYVSEQTAFVIRVHPIVQQQFYAPNMRASANAADHLKDHRWYSQAVSFCENYDENCFDTQYNNMTLEEFTPMVHEVFGRDPWSLRG
jgi:predicted HD phosphohydrolase